MASVAAQKICRKRIVQWYEHLVQIMENGEAHMVVPVGRALSQPKESIHKYLHIGQ